MTRPNITPGEWNKKEAHAVIAENGYCVCDTDPEGRDELEDDANMKAIAAIPQVLAALESAYNRACEAVETHFHSRGKMRKQVWHSEENTRKQLEAIRDEYKTALTAAGYQF